MLHQVWRVVLVALVLLCADVARAGVADDAKIIPSAGLKYLANHQNADGSYGDPTDKATLVNKTAIVLYALASNGRKYGYESGPFVSGAVDFLLKSQSADGSFGDVETTLNALTALKAVKWGGATQAIERAADHIKDKPTPAAVMLAGLLIAPAVASTFGSSGELSTGKDAAKAEATIKAIKKMQELKNLSPAEFGKVKALGEGIYADPVVATALASIVGDRIENNPAFK